MDWIDSERAFLARNSWGLTWGMGGHAWLPIPYVNSRAVDIIEVEDES
jgi:C1A family cysteine protease